jgi:hypothetical protein
VRLVVQTLNRIEHQEVEMKSVPANRSRGMTMSTETRARLLLLSAAAVSFVLSVSLWFSGNKLQGIFVGIWVPSILALGSIVLPRGDGR